MPLSISIQGTLDTLTAILLLGLAVNSIALALWCVWTARH